jgi:hypothetical protein
MIKLKQKLIAQSQLLCTYYAVIPPLKVLKKELSKTSYVLESILKRVERAETKYLKSRLDFSQKDQERLDYQATDTVSDLRAEPPSTQKPLFGANS